MDYDDAWDDINDWRIDNISDRTGYSEAEIEQAHIEIFQDMVPDDFSNEQEQRMWEDYLDAMINGSMTREEFFEEYDIDPEDFDWGAWREAMGY